MSASTPSFARLRKRHSGNPTRADYRGTAGAAGNLPRAPRYLSPELIRGKEAGPVSDLWSVGVVAYEILTAERLFDGQTVPDMLSAIMNVDPVYRDVAKNFNTGTKPTRYLATSMFNLHGSGDQDNHLIDRARAALGNV